MRILIEAESTRLRLLLPTNLLFSSGTAWLVNHIGRHYAREALENIPPETLRELFAVIRSIKRTYGSFELLDVTSAGGERVWIRL